MKWAHFNRLYVLISQKHPMGNKMSQLGPEAFHGGNNNVSKEPFIVYTNVFSMTFHWWAHIAGTSDSLFFPVPNRVFVLQKGIENRLAEIVYFGGCVYTTFTRTVKSEIGGAARDRMSLVVVVVGTFSCIQLLLYNITRVRVAWYSGILRIMGCS